MNEGEKQKIGEAKDNWLMHGNIGAVAACDFLLMKDQGLDIVYDAENELVKEYCDLLKKRLETDPDRLVLMVSVEVERCLMDEKEELYRYLNDEIYEHFQKGGKEYPIQAVGFHIEVIKTLYCLDYVRAVERYMRMILDTQRMVLGEESFLFCRNWCCIVNDALCIFMPAAAVSEFDRNVDVLSKVLREEDILYRLCMNIAVLKMKQEKNTDYLKQAVDLCEVWCRDIPVGQQKEKQSLIRRMRAINYRNIGELDLAIEKFWEEVQLSENIQHKLYMLSQTAGMLFTKREFSMFPDILEEGEKLVAAMQEPDEFAAGFYNICGVYYTVKGQYEEALSQFDRAIAIGGQVMGEEADDTIRFKYCRLVAECDMGEKEKACEGMKRLYQMICNDTDRYPQSLPFVFNGMIMMNLESSINSETVKRMKNRMKIYQNQYDLPTSLYLKSGLYYLMMADEDIHERDEWEALRGELEGFFRRYPYAEGGLQYLMGEYYRCLKEETSLEGEAVGRALDRAEAYWAHTPFAVNSMDRFQYYFMELRNLLYKKNYIAAARKLQSLRESIIMPLYDALCHAREDRIAGVFTILNSYVSLFVSTVQQYPRLRITAKELYELIWNVKYFEDLFYCRRQEFVSMVKQRKWLSEKDIDISGEDLVIECFDYIRTDMRDPRTVFRILEPDLKCLVHQIYFALHLSPGIFSKRTVEVIGDVSYMELHKKISDSYNMEKVSEIERTAWDKLQKYLHKKRKIFFCCGDAEVLMPLAFVRMNAEQYLGDIYQIIYCNCNTAKDIKGDMAVQNISDSIFFGVSEFDGDRESQEIQRRFNDLLFTELVIEGLGKLTGGRIYLNEKKPKEHSCNSEKMPIE